MKFNGMDWPQEYYPAAPNVMRNFCLVPVIKSCYTVRIFVAGKKLLYIDVRNKYCAICSTAQKYSSSPPQHMCFKNWSSSSTTMEADIIAADFRQSEAMHEVRCMKVVGDGDSSVLYTIHTTVLYVRQVSKLECANHCVKGHT